jgi:hypothetical protein
MATQPPGWYRHPKRPGVLTYWDGNAWVDVDTADDTPPEPAEPKEHRLVKQRGKPESE